MSDRIEELIAAGEVEFHLPSIKGRDDMFSLVTQGVGIEQISTGDASIDLTPTLQGVAEAQRAVTAWEMMDWLDKFRAYFMLPSNIATSPMMVMSTIIEATLQKLREQGIERG